MALAADGHLFAVLQAQSKVPGHGDAICFSSIEHVIFCWSVLYQDAETGKYFIEITSGTKRFKKELARPKEINGEYNWHSMVSIKQSGTSGKSFLCAIAVEKTTNRSVAASFQVKIADSLLIDIDEKLIDINTIANDCKLLSIQRNSKNSAIDCVLVSSQSSNSSLYHHLQLSFDGNGLICQKMIDKNVKISSEWNDPIIVGDRIYFMHTSKNRLLRIRKNSEEFKEQIPEENIELSGMGHGFANLGQTTAIFADSAIYYLQDEGIGQLWLLDIKHGSWQKLHSFFNHVLTQESTIVDVLSKGKLYAHGNCSENDCIEKAHVYCLELMPEKITNPTQKMRWEDVKGRIAPVELKTVVFNREDHRVNAQDPIPQFEKQVQVIEQEELATPMQNEPQELKKMNEEKAESAGSPEHQDEPQPKPAHALGQKLKFPPQQPSPSSNYIPQTQKKNPKKLNRVWPPPPEGSSAANDVKEPIAPTPATRTRNKDALENIKDTPPRPQPIPVEKQKEQPAEQKERQSPLEEQQPIPQQKTDNEQLQEQKQIPSKMREPEKIVEVAPASFTRKSIPVEPSRSPKETNAEVEWMPKSCKPVEKLGEGAFGIVWKCVDEEDLRCFVAKEAKITDEEDIQLAKNEVEHLKTLNHKHVIKYYGCLAETHSVIIFMEFMPGGSLRHIIDNVGAMNETTAVKYIRQILDGLAYIHSKLILHSDLKCDNLLLDGNGIVKIGDFGIAVQMCLNNDKQSFIMPGVLGGGGTLYWMAPEVIKNEKLGKTDEKYGRAADMWSLGCTIVEMLTAYPPYFIDYPTEPRFLGALGGNILSYNPHEIAPKASMPMSMFLFGLFVVDKKKRIQVGADAQASFQKMFPE